MYSTACININCTDEFHMLWRRAVRRVHMIFLWAWLKKMHDSCAFVFQYSKFPLYFIIVWNKGYLVWKRFELSMSHMNWCGQEVKHFASNKPFPSSTNPMTMIVIIQGSLAYMKIFFILTAHFTLQQFITKTITKTRKKKMVKSIIKLDAYLHLPGLSVGNKLCSLCLHLPKFFMQLLVYPVTVFSLGRQSLKNQVTPMSDQKKTQMRMALSDLKLIIIDEISVVSNTLLLHIHQQLTNPNPNPNPVFPVYFSYP